MTLSLYEHFIEETKMKLSQDDRFIALLAGGSMLKGTMDEYSDLDLVLVYEPEYRETIMTERIQIAERLGSLLSGFTGEHVGEPRLVICLYGPPPLHVDLKFVTPSELEQRIENPLILWERGSEAVRRMRNTQPSYPELNVQWIEDRFWVWVHYGATKLGRGELFEFIDLITYIRRAVLGPMIATIHGQQPNGVRKLEFFAAKVTEELVKTIPLHHAESCYQSLLTSIQIYKRLRSDFQDLHLRREAESVAVDYLNEVFSSLKR
ncbi:nucleotidyltransferase domain-containing protein [Paenibacillus sedimenti]|uniref:Nucleotidyltransferase domain-containing protein n=1 Tax=Paenibacillus sedimenti TaxID=2770274 RepID=A0A926KYD1_9BACL|nr:nucleotidyltransferase domain-containing protein [Paenibacillus sedimenti]MBD0384215.1 nucleotidyltransferase domain-containing protein [Paenibacillus sedimenti]